MATKHQFKSTTEERRMRRFSTELKQKLVGN